MNFYIVDEEDPLVQTYANMFPDLFTDDIPENLQDHFRYPERLFSIQAEMYGTYHMENLEVFYNREDFWQFPTEKYYDQDIEMDPYYVTMKLPGSRTRGICIDDAIHTTTATKYDCMDWCS